MQQSENKTRSEEPLAPAQPEKAPTQPEKEQPGTRGYKDTIITVLTWLFRICLGGTFIFSGVVKAVDPWGTVYKMHDYIMAMPEGFMHKLLPLLTVSAFVLFCAETLLGAAIITGSYRRLSAVGSALMMLIMLPLTLWIALKDPVPDCGCFGDALILTNWQTFWKNVALTIMAGWLVVFNRRARCLIIPTLQWLMITGTVAFAVCVGFIGYSIQPMLDFRPYPVGGPLIDNDQEVIDADTESMMAIWQRGDEQITIPADSIPEGEDWEFVDRVATADTVSEPEKEKKQVKGLAIFDGAEDVTEDLIAPEGEQVVVCMTNLPNLSSGNFYKLNSLYAYCQKHGIEMVTIAAATPLEIQDFIDHSLAEYPIYNAEDTAIKEVVRGNPAVIYLNNGKIVWKQALSAIPTYDFVESTPDAPYALGSYAPFSDKSTFKGLCLIWLIYMAIVLVLSHVPMVIRFTTRKLKRYKWVKDGQVLKAVAVVLSASCMLASCSNDDPQPDDVIEVTKTRTILVYMVATNSLNPDSSDDIDEMLRGYKACPAGCTNLLVYKTDLNGNAPTLSVVQTKKDGTAYLKELKAYSGSQSSVSKARMSEVVADMKMFAPAADYGLFLWSHATAWLPPATPADAEAAPGPMRAYGDDYGKSISITNLALALPKDTFSFIWMDCCLMSSIEVVYQLRNHCQTIIGYPTEVLAGGAPYQDVLPHLLNQDMSIEKAAQATFDFYANNPAERYQSCTVSVINTEWLGELADVARAIAQNGNVDISTQGLQRYGKNSGIPFYDFRQTFMLIDGAASPHGQALEQALNKVVSLKLATPKFLDITVNPDYFSGLSCHVIDPASNTAAENYYRSLDWYKDIYL